MARPATSAQAARERSLATVSAVAMVLLVVYASLYPFEGWRWPAGLSPSQAFTLPWPRWRDHADEWFNLLGYIPVGFLMGVAFMRAGMPPWWAAIGAGLGASSLSYAMEVVQVMLPTRVPSLRDWVGNSAGAWLGAVLSMVSHHIGFLDRWRRLRNRWFTRDSATPLVLLLLWPAALLVPAPLPFALGQFWDELMALLVPLIAQLPLSHIGLDIDLGAAAPARAGLAPLTEVLAISLGLVSPLALVGAVAPIGARRAWFMLAVGLMGVAGMTLSTALNFGPDHAMAWLTPTAVLALIVAVPVALVLLVPDSRLCAVVGLLVLVTAVALDAQARTDVYYAESLHAWEQGKFIRFHGAAQWVGWLWPYVAMGWLVQRLRRHPESLQFRA